MLGDDDGIVTPPTHEDISRDNHGKDLGGGSFQRSYRNICAVLPMCVEISGVNDGRVPDKDEKHRNT